MRAAPYGVPQRCLLATGLQLRTGRAGLSPGSCAAPRCFWRTVVPPPGSVPAQGGCGCDGGEAAAGEPGSGLSIAAAEAAVTPGLSPGRSSPPRRRCCARSGSWRRRGRSWPWSGSSSTSSCPRSCGTRSRTEPRALPPLTAQTAARPPAPI